MKGTALFSSIKKHGFSLVSISPSSSKQLQKSLRLFVEDDTFRFPPPEGHPYPNWPAVHQESYNMLVHIAIDCFKALLVEMKENEMIPSSHKDKVREVLEIQKELDFSQGSFMNLFNYHHGHLAPHVDRCLVTVVYTFQLNSETRSKKFTSSSQRKNLWCHVPGQNVEDIKNWASIDKLVTSPDDCDDDRQHSVCLHVGEELSTLSGGHLPAALHCVQCDPTSPPVPIEHKAGSQRDIIAQTSAFSNRLSAALILSSADVSALIEDIDT